jgi:hypothetical protein
LAEPFLHCRHIGDRIPAKEKWFAIGEVKAEAVFPYVKRTDSALSSF